MASILACQTLINVPGAAQIPSVLRKVPQPKAHVERAPLAKSVPRDLAVAAHVLLESMVQLAVIATRAITALVEAELPVQRESITIS